MVYVRFGGRFPGPGKRRVYPAARPAGRWDRLIYLTLESLVAVLYDCCRAAAVVAVAVDAAEAEAAAGNTVAAA